MRAVLIVLVGLLLTSCATQPHAAAQTPGFLYGLLHGFIAPLSLIGSIFYDVRIYAFPNSGGWYDFGYFLGFGALCSGGSRAVLQIKISHHP
jgi:hypothetical protein